MNELDCEVEAFTGVTWLKNMLFPTLSYKLKLFFPDPSFCFHFFPIHICLANQIHLFLVPVKNASNLRARFENIAKNNDEEARKRVEEEKRQRQEKDKKV